MLAPLVVIASMIASEGTAPKLDAATARVAFRELDELCRSDGGKLWGVSLCGPVMLVDSQTRTFYANASPPGADAGTPDAPFSGTLPQDQNVSNTAFQWHGLRWSQVAWPLPEDADPRHSLLLHESFHRVEGRVFEHPAPGPGGNGHLDTIDGRVLLQLEWRALRKALLSKGAARRSAIEDALAFRAARRAKFMTAAADENSLELNEGLAEYTGDKLAASSPAQTMTLVLRSMEQASGRPTFVRSFAYASGPAYGLLLDDAAPGWRKSLSKKSDLGQMLGRASRLRVGVEYPEHTDARAGAYDGKALRAFEEKRVEEAKVRADTYRRRLVEGPVLRLDLRQMKIQFDPGTLVALGDSGTVYPTGRIVGAWGILTVTGGVLLDRGWKFAAVPAPIAGAPQGDGWTLALAPGWSVVPGKRPGDFRLRGPAQASDVER